MYYSPDHFYSPDDEDIDEDERINAHDADLENERLMEDHERKENGI